MIAEVWQFLKRIWWHLWLLVPGSFLVTFLHESAHALAVVWQGGEVLELVIWPSGEHWGFTSYVFPDGVAYSDFLISLAPYFLWLGVAFLATLMALLPIRWRFWSASLIYFWWFVAPLADVANAALPWWLRRAENDWLSGLGEAPAWVALPMLLGLAAAFAWGHALQRRLFRDRRLGVGAFAILYTAVLAALIGVALI